MSGGGGSNTTTSTKVEYSPEEEARRKKVFDAADQAYGTAKDSYANIMNPTGAPVGPSGATNQAQQMISGYAQGQGSQLATSAGNAANFGLSGAVLDPNQNPGFQGSLNTALRKVDEKYTDAGGVLSQIRNNFSASAPGGQSSREGIAMGLAGKSYLNTVGDVTSTMTSDAYGKGLDYMKSSMAFAPNMYNLGVQPGISMGAVGQQQEAYTQAQNDYTAQGQMWNANKDWAALQPYTSLITGASSAGSSATGPAPKGPGAMGVLGGAAMGAYIGSVVPGIGTAIGAAAGAILGYAMQ